MNVDMLVFGAHPDDAEIGMGGTIAKQTAAGGRVVLCDLTYAEMSSNGDVQTRQAEAKEAAAILHVHERINLGLPDRGLAMQQEQLDEITKVIRTYKPKIIFAPYWIDRHPDHMMCSQMIEGAVFNAKLRRYMPQHQAVNVEQLYFYHINGMDAPDILVDTTETFAQKKQALMAYRSQFTTSSKSVKTPLNQGYVERVEARDQLFGQSHSLAYAEGFMTKTPYLVDQFN